MPNRIIKESICTSDTIDKMSWFEECFWNRLIVNCDDYGRMDARPAVLRARLFPLKERITHKDIESALTKLADIGCVILYACDGRPYLYLPTWEVHQTIRAKKSKYPSPDSGVKSSEIICKQMNADASICPRNPIQSESESNTSTPSIISPTKPVAHERGQYGWVKLTDEEYSRLVSDLGEQEAERAIAYVDESAQSTGNKNKWRDWNLVVRKASREGWGLNKRVSPARKARTSNHEQRKYTPGELQNVGVNLLDREDI